MIQIIPLKLFSLNTFRSCVNAGLKYPMSQTSYTQTGRKLEKWVKILDVAFLKVTPALTIGPTLIVSYIKYFITDLGETAFKLPAPIWYSRLRCHFYSKCNEI